MAEIRIIELDDSGDLEDGMYVAVDSEDGTYKYELNTEATETVNGLMSAEDKLKLNGVAAGAQVNVIESISVNSTAIAPVSKNVDVTVPTKLSDLTDDSDFLKSTDISSWAKQPSKPTYTASEVGALPDSTTIPSKLSDLTNDNNTVTDASYVHTDNNYTDSEKAKLSGIETGAQENVIETVKVNGTALTPASKAVDVTIPTATSQLTNDSNFPVDASYVHTDNNYTTAEKTKLAGIAEGADATPIATTSTAGKVIPDGTTVTVDNDGTIHAAEQYTLPTMGATTKGGAKLGDGLSVSDDTLSLSSLTKPSTSEVSGPLAEVTAKGWATQASTTGKNLLNLNHFASRSNWYTINDGSSLTVKSTDGAGWNTIPEVALSAGTYTLSIYGLSGYAEIKTSNDDYTEIIYIRPEQIDKTATITLNSDGGIKFKVGIYGTFPFTCYPQLELGSTATPYEPYTGGAPSPSPDYPQPIVTVRGRNLIDESKSEQGYLDSVGAHHAEGQASYTTDFIEVYPNSSYVLSVLASDSVISSNNRRICQYDASKSFVKLLDYVSVVSGVTTIIDTVASARYIRLVYDAQKAGKVQLTEGSTPQPYVPYGYVGLDVYDGSTHLSTTPIPLPPRGWVAGLPDGTADELRLNGAGKCKWTLPTDEVVLDGSESGWSSITGGLRTAINVNGIKRSSSSQEIANAFCSHFITSSMNETSTGAIGVAIGNVVDQIVFAPTGEVVALADFKAWLSTHPITVLYPIATPVTEDCGYIDLPNIPAGATVSIPELESFGCKCWLDSDGSIHALMNAWKERIDTEHEEVLDEHEEAIAELAEYLEAAKAEYREKFTAVDSWITAASQLRRGSDGYYVNESITAMLAQRFDGKLYGYSEPKTTATEVTKTGANAGITNPTLGTVTVAGSSAYRHLGPFQWLAAKGSVDADGVPHIKVIRGVDSDADWNACTENVWSLRPIQWWDVDSSGTTVIGSLSDTWHQGLRPNPQAYLPDGTLRPFMLAARYPLGFDGATGVSKSGMKCYGRDVSHNSLITKLDYANSGYSGKTVYEQWYDAFMSRMIYGTKDIQTVMQGCTDYNYQYAPAVAETGVKRVILTNAQAANLVVGSRMMLGTHTGNNDRNTASNYDIFDGLAIASIEDYDASNKAIVLDTDSTFDTETTYLLSTAPWNSGACDGMDWDGSPTDSQSKKEPAFFQGCEVMHGATEVLAGVILSNDGTSGWIPYITRDTRYDATSVTSDFESCGDALPTTGSDDWKYPLYIDSHKGLMYGTTTGASNTTGASDGHYTLKLATTGTREWLSLGHLSHGRSAGFSCVSGLSTLGGAYWSFWSRLSGVGRSRG